MELPISSIRPAYHPQLMTSDLADVPAVLGRGIVVPAGVELPARWNGTASFDLTDEVVGNPLALDVFVDQLHHRWVTREAVVVRWAIDRASINEIESWNGDVWSLNARFLFPLERLRVLLFANNYDARQGDPRWWYSTKAVKLVGATEGGSADVVLADGTPVWVDGGPRQPLDVDATNGIAVIAGEEVDLGATCFLTGLPAAEVGGLAPDQLAAVRHLAGAARVIAPAGSGKTRTLAARLRHLLDDRQVSQRSVTAVAYNKRAADELRERAGAPSHCVRTVHSLGWAILRDAHPGIGLISESDVRQILDRFVKINPRANADPMAPYLEALDQVRLGLRSPSSVEADGDDIAGFADAFGPLRRTMYQQQAVDHGEQIYGAIEALLGDHALRDRWQQRCRHLLVDEFQDLTPAYVLLLRLLASPRLQVFGVGDDDQVIYGYSGADPGFLIGFEKYFPAATPYALQTNYRCPEPVVTGAATLLSCNERRIDKTILAGPAASSDASTLQAIRKPSGELAVAAAEQIGQWIASGVAPRDIAVLTRVNSALIPMKAALVEAGIATDDLLGSASIQRTMVRGLFAWLRIVRMTDDMHRTDVLEAIKRPGRGLNRVASTTNLASRMSLDELRDASRQLEAKHEKKWLTFCDDIAGAARVASTNDAVGTITAIVESTKLAQTAAALDTSRNTASTSSHEDDLVAIRRAAAIHPELDGFQRWLRSAVEEPSSPDGVLLSSVHRVKGMEWPRVIVLGADHNSMPHKLSTDIEEERRVFHVAITRGQEQVVVFADEDRPSRFIDEMFGIVPPEPEPIVRQATTSRATTSRATRKGRVAEPKTMMCMPGDRIGIAGGFEGVVAEVRDDELIVELDSGANMSVRPSEVRQIIEAVPRPDAEVGDLDVEVADALREWRRDTARDIGMPPYIVFNDKTLEALATDLPRDDQELLAISGIGPTKLENYGDDILAIIDDHVDSRP